MPTVKVAVTLEEETLERLDKLVEKRVFVNRSRAIQQAVKGETGPDGTGAVGA